MVKLLEDYIDRIQEKFPEFTKEELKNILKFGLLRYTDAMKHGADVILLNNKEDVYTARCGKVAPNALAHYKMFISKWRMKVRRLFKYRKLKWDGYYYIGLTENQHKSVKKRGNKYVFENIYMVKLLDELHHIKHIKHIWRVPWPTDCGWKFFKEKLRTEHAVYLGENEYEKYHQCFLGRNQHGSTSSESTAENNDQCSECNTSNR